MLLLTSNFHTHYRRSLFWGEGVCVCVAGGMVMWNGADKTMTITLNMTVIDGFTKKFKKKFNQCENV